jgi:hypothetical protein
MGLRPGLLVSISLASSLSASSNSLACLSRSARRIASTMPPSDLSDESGEFGGGGGPGEPLSDSRLPRLKDSWRPLLKKVSWQRHWEVSWRSLLSPEFLASLTTLAFRTTTLVMDIAAVMMGIAAMMMDIAAGVVTGIAAIVVGIGIAAVMMDIAAGMMGIAAVVMGIAAIVVGIGIAASVIGKCATIVECFVAAVMYSASALDISVALEYATVMDGASAISPQLYSKLQK